MSENRTRETGASVRTFLSGVDNRTRREDAFTLMEIMSRVSGTEPRMWGPSIIAFGSYHYRYASGHEGDAPRIGFSPRKANLALYLTSRDERYESDLAKLGKHRTGVSCLYINRLADIDLEVLETMIARSWDAARARYGEPA